MGSISENANAATKLGVDGSSLQHRFAIAAVEGKTGVAPAAARLVGFETVAFSVGVKGARMFGVQSAVIFQAHEFFHDGEHIILAGPAFTIKRMHSKAGRPVA